MVHQWRKLATLTKPGLPLSATLKVDFLIVVALDGTGDVIGPGARLRWA